MTKSIFLSPEGMKVFWDYMTHLFLSSSLTAVFIALFAIHFPVDIYTNNGMSKVIGLAFFACLSIYAYLSATSTFLNGTQNIFKIKNNIPPTDKMTAKGLFCNSKVNLIEVIISWAMVGLCVVVVKETAINTAFGIIAARQ